MLNFDKVGATKAILSEHVFSKEVKDEIQSYTAMTCIGLGQGGGRIASELSRFGIPTYLVNSSKLDMKEHSSLIPENRRFLTKSEEYPELEGTDKDAQLGFQIAKENADVYKTIALSPDVQDADFVWVCVSLGGGTGNGALKVALAYLSQVRKNKQLPNGRVPLGVICSLPSKDERGSSFRKNALAGINLLESMIKEGSLGSVLVIDNEKMSDYYAKTPLETYRGNQIDAKSYSNMLVASLIIEVASLPLLEGRSVYDKTEFLGTISAPGWLSLSKLTDIESDDSLDVLINNLYTENEVLAESKIGNTIAGAIGIIYPKGKKVSPRIADDVYKYASELLDTKVNLSIATNSALKKMSLYGLSVSLNLPLRVEELKSELIEWEKREQEKLDSVKNEERTDLSEFDNFFNAPAARRKKVTVLDDIFGENSNEVAKRITDEDLDDITF